MKQSGPAVLVAPAGGAIGLSTLVLGRSATAVEMCLCRIGELIEPI